MAGHRLTKSADTNDRFETPDGTPRAFDRAASLSGLTLCALREIGGRGAMSRKRTWKLKRPRKRTHRAPNAWQRSLAFREIGRAAIIAFNATRKKLPKCGAKTRTTGAPCQNLALENGRCRLHGGATPSGKKWGKRQVSTKTSTYQSKGDWRRVEEKLQRWASEDRDRVRRLRQMSDDSFYAYVRRMGRRLDDPHAPIIKNAIREEFARRGPPPSTMTSGTTTPRSADPDLAEIEARLADLRQQLDELEADPLHQGVFA